MIKLLPRLGQIIMVFLTFWVSLFFAWQTLSIVSFCYPLLYDALDIGAVIQQYAPLNSYKFGFEQTLREQHITLFSEIVLAINQGGQGLAQLVYYDTKGHVMDTLLRPPEIVHLQDVANLLDRLRLSEYWAMVLLLGLIVVFKLTKTSLEYLKQTFVMVLGMIIIVSVAIFLYGAQNLFYALHVAVFPENHQWFFYYQESLMTTLMKAPDIFAVIAALLVGMALVYFIMMLWGIRQFLNLNKLESRGVD